jgi:phosphoribosylformylglycinamidine synthase
MIAFAEGVDPFVALFSESSGRALVAIPRGHETAFVALLDEHRLPYTPLGVVGGEALEVRGHFAIPLDELRTAWTSTLPDLFDRPGPVSAPVSVELEIEVDSDATPEADAAPEADAD